MSNTTITQPTISNADLLSAMQDNFKVIYQQLATVQQDISGVKNEVHGLKQGFSELTQVQKATNQEIELMQISLTQYADDVEGRFNGIESRFDGVETRFQEVNSEIRSIKRDMVTKSYLDDKLANYGGRVVTLTKILHNKAVISTIEMHRVLQLT